MEKHIPLYIRNQILHADIFPDGPRKRKYVVLTNKGPHLFEIWNQHIIASCDLSASVLKEYSDESSSGNISIKIQFSYAKCVRITHYVLTMKKHTLIISKSSLNDKLMISRQFPNMPKVEIIPDSECPGQVVVRLYQANGEHGSDVCLADIHKSPTDDSSAKPVYGRMYNNLNEQLLKAQCELATARLSGEQKYRDLSESLQFGRPAVRGDAIHEKTILAKYGDIWVRTINDRIVFGVPIFNSTLKRKQVANNIRPACHCALMPELQFTFQLYHCRLDMCLAPVLDAVLDLDEDELSRKMSFDHEWKSQHSLLPEMAAILVLTCTTPSFIEHAAYEFHLFVNYDVQITQAGEQNNKSTTFQLNCGRCTVDTNLLFRAEYLPTFHVDTMFKDVLAVVATSQSHVVELMWSGTDASSVNILDELLVRQMLFALVKDCKDEIDLDHYINNLLDVEQSTVMAVAPTVELRSCDVFYKTRDGFFKGMLIRRFRQSSHRHVLKIYSRSSLENDRFVQLLRQQCGPSVSISLDESMSRATNERQRICQLAAAIRSEMNFLEKFVQSEVATRQQIKDFVCDRAVCELQTDMFCTF